MAEVGILKVLSATVTSNVSAVVRVMIPLTTEPSFRSIVCDACCAEEGTGYSSDRSTTIAKTDHRAFILFYTLL
jgi:hypothetical protein